MQAFFLILSMTFPHAFPEVILHLNLTIMVSDPKTLLEGTDSWCRPTIRSENVYMCSGEWLQVTYFVI